MQTGAKQGSSAPPQPPAQPAPGGDTGGGSDTVVGHTRSCGLGAPTQGGGDSLPEEAGVTEEGKAEKGMNARQRRFCVWRPRAREMHAVRARSGARGLSRPHHTTPNLRFATAAHADLQALPESLDLCLHLHEACTDQLEV